MPAGRNVQSRRAARRGRTAGAAAVVAHHQEAGPGPVELGEQERQEGILRVGVERRGRLVRDHDLRRADHRPGRGHALLLAHAQARGRLVRDVGHAQPRQQAQRLAITPPRRRRSGAKPSGSSTLSTADR